jgi:hypothetical protein
MGDKDAPANSTDQYYLAAEKLKIPPVTLEFFKIYTNLPENQITPHILNIVSS